MQYTSFYLRHILLNKKVFRANRTGGFTPPGYGIWKGWSGLAGGNSGGDPGGGTAPNAEGEGAEGEGQDSHAGTGGTVLFKVNNATAAVRAAAAGAHGQGRDSEADARGRSTQDGCLSF